MHRPTPNKRQLGMSIVELMVAVVISLIGVLVIFQVFAVNEGVRRGTIAGSDEQTSGLLGLMLLERELRHAGFGINDLDLIGCTMRTYDNMRVPALQDDFPLTAVEIKSNAGTVPDVIRVIYGGVTQTTAAVKFGNDMDNPTDPIQLVSRFGFCPADVVVVGQPGIVCTLREITSLSALVELDHTQSPYLGGRKPDGTCKKDSLTPRFNDPAGTPVLYKFMQGAKVMNLGPFPVRNEITVRNDKADPTQNNQLVAQNLWAQMASPTAIAEQIVHLKAEYGMDNGKNNGTVVRDAYSADDNIVDNYTGSSPTTAAEWQLVRSVRVAIVSRTNIVEKPNSGTACDATPDFGDPAYPVRWARGPDAPNGRPIDVRTTPNWRCFKYRVYESTVPLRNLLWRQG